MNEIILPNCADIIKNEWVILPSGRKRFINNLFIQTSGMNPKRNSDIAILAIDVLTAIEQEKRLNNDIRLAKGQLTSNIGNIISTIIKDQGDNCQ